MKLAEAKERKGWGRLQAQFKLGQLLREMDKNKGAATPLHHARASVPTYREMGIETTAAHRWQKVAAALVEGATMGRVEEHGDGFE